MKHITLDSRYCRDFYGMDEYDAMNRIAIESLFLLENKRGEGSDFLGWHDPCSKNGEMSRILECAERIRMDSDVLIVIGIGGSYLGAKAVIEALQKRKDRGKMTEVLFIGNNISGAYTRELMNYIRERDVCINVISKSGTTTEPAITFRMLRKVMEEKYKGDAKNRIYATTDPNKGILRRIALAEGYTVFEIPDDIGGRYSMFTPAGLLPVAVAGLDIHAFQKGACRAYVECLGNKESFAMEYATIRNTLFKKGKTIEIMANYHPQLVFLTEWWKQLFGESEGKCNTGIFPAGVTMTTDLHSMGQYIQEGMRNLLETVIHVEDMYDDIEIPYIDHDEDGLNYLAGKTMNYVNTKAMEATLQAHTSGGVPNILVRVPQMNEEYLGMLMYYLMKSCGISGYTLGVNPFDQPGVEEYKKNMFRLLGKT
ncbi:MAG: glucose-6-phosphate isomerase [Clostridia bacterium]